MALTLPNTESQTVADLITGALRNINSLEAGETPGPVAMQDAIQVLNDMLESWSQEHLLVFAQTEYRFNWVPGQYQYTIGNPLIGTFTGTVTSGSPIITNVTPPANLSTGAYLTDASVYGGAGVIPVYSAPTSALNIGGVPATTVSAIAPTTVTMSVGALSTPATTDVIVYSQPGDIAYDSNTGAPISVPLRIVNAFTRITNNGGNPMVNGIDYQMRIINRDKYAALGLKGISGPWPTDLYFDRTFPLGNIYVYPNPSQGGECHLWVDQILSDLTSPTTPINLPLGYSRAVKTNLAIELASEYGKPVTPLLAQRAKESKAAIKQLNAQAPIEAFFDAHLLKSRQADAGWILYGGFYT